MNDTPLLILIAAFGFVAVLLTAKWLVARVRTTTIWQHQTGLHFKHGRFVRELGSGRHFLFGSGHEVVTLDLRLTEAVVPSQELLTADGASLRLTAVAQWRIVDPHRFLAASDNPRQALHTRIQLALRELLGGQAFDAVLEGKTGFGPALLERVRESAATDLGIEVVSLEIRDLLLGPELKKAQAEILTARKESLAKLEKARGEAAALRTLANGARVLESHPDLVRLRFLELVKDAGRGHQFVIGLSPDLVGLTKKD